MPPKSPQRSRRRNQTVDIERDGENFVINVPSIKGAPKAKSPTKFKTRAAAEEAQRKLGKAFAVRSFSSTRGSATPGGGKSKGKRSRVGK